MLPVKSNRLNQPPVVNVGMAAPPLRDKLTAFDVDPPPLPPKLNDAVTPIALTKPPTPVQVNPVTTLIPNLTVAAVVWVKEILPAVVLPNAIERVLLLVELKIPVDNVTPSDRDKAPCANVYVDVAVSDVDTVTLTVPKVWLNAAVVGNVPPLRFTVPELVTLTVAALSIAPAECVNVPLSTRNMPVEVNVSLIVVVPLRTFTAANVFARPVIIWLDVETIFVVTLL